MAHPARRHRAHVANITETPLGDLVRSERQVQFGRDKRDTLPEFCRSCDVRFACHGGCPKDRFVPSRDGQDGHNYLCDGLYDFYTHTRPTMTAMAQLIRQGRYADEIMPTIAASDAKRGRNDPCPCGSGATFTTCHGTPSAREVARGRT